MLDGTHFFECTCGSSEHTLRFILEKDGGMNGEPEIHTEIFLNNWQRWWVRVWIGFKYMFGYTSRYGHWDCWILNTKDAQRLKDMCDEVISEE